MQPLTQSYEGHTYVVGLVNDVADAQRRLDADQYNDSFVEASKEVDELNRYHRVMGDPERYQLYEVELKIYPINQ